MAISEQARQIQDGVRSPKAPGELISIDFKTGEVRKPHKRHSYDELVVLFGEDYRRRALEPFLKKGVIKDPEEVKWLEPEDPLREHPGSEVDYLVWMRKGTSILAISVLPAGSKSSGEHEHPGKEKSDPYKVIETYHVDRGKCELWLEGKPLRLEEGETVDVWPGVGHRIQNPNGHPALLRIFIGNGALYSPEELHRRRE